MSDETDAEHSLVMPFLPVWSNGGPFDDAAFCAGYEMGQLDVRLAGPIGLGGPAELVTTLREENREQADLIAMRHGYIAEFQHSRVDGWVHVRFRRVVSGEAP